MKTLNKLESASLALIACGALSANAAIINVTYHDANTLEFFSGDTTPAAENYFFVVGSGGGQSLADITATPSGNDVNYSVYWANAAYQINDTFVLTTSGPVGFSGSHHEYRPLVGRWFFTYDNPNPVQSQVPDGGSALIALGAALLGLWRIRR